MTNKIGHIILFLLPLMSCHQTKTQDPVLEWIAEQAILISTVEAGNGFNDLQALSAMVGDARIVSLGEPTHGNREVFQLKHRMIEYLVTEKGFNVLALECPFGEAFDVNRYIEHGIGDPEKALAGIYYWTWDTQEFLALIQWLRNYNSKQNNENKVRFYGFDLQDPERAARISLEYISKVDPLLAEAVLPELHILQVPFSIPQIMGRRQYIPKEYDSTSLLTIRWVLKALDEKRESYVNATSHKEWTLARQHAQQVEMYIEANTRDGENYVRVRESGQAENIKWILDHEGDASKIIVWAHNSHVANAAPKGEHIMGHYLRKWYGDQIKIFGFFFDHGGFKALDVDTPSKGMFPFSVGNAPVGTLEHKLSSAGLGLAALDLRRLPEKGPVRDWFHSKQPTRHSGAGYNEKKPQDYFWSYTPAEAFDALVFLDSTMPVKSIDEADYEAIWMLDKKLPKPTNLDFENGKAGEAPESWLSWSKFSRLGIQLQVTDKDPYQGRHSAMIYQPMGHSYGEISPNLTQTIDATPYKGKTIKLKAACRAELEYPGFAFLRLSIDPDILQSAHDGSPPLFDNLDSVRIQTSRWSIFQIQAKVPEYAETITYGVYLRDPGTVWLDALELEVQ